MSNIQGENVEISRGTQISGSKWKSPVRTCLQRVHAATLHRKTGWEARQTRRSLRPRPGSRHAWQTQEVAPGPARLLLARDSHPGRKHRADLRRRPTGSAFAWHLIQWEPTSSNAGWICLSQKHQNRAV